MNKILVSLILSLTLTAPAFAQLVHQSSHSINTASNLFAGGTTYNYGFNGATIGSGRLVVLFTKTEIRTVTGISGTNLTMTQLGSTSSNAADFKGQLWWGISTGSVTSVTLTASGATGDPACVSYAEFSGHASDQSGATNNGSANDNVTAHNSGSVTPATANNVVVIGSGRTDATWTEDGAFTLVSSADAGCQFAYLTQTAATAQEYNSSSDINRYSVMRIGAFSGAAGSGGATPKGLLLGVYP